MQKTAYEMRISDWSSDVCSSDLRLIREDKRLKVVFREQIQSRRPGFLCHVIPDAPEAIENRAFGTLIAVAAFCEVKQRTAHGFECASLVIEFFRMHQGQLLDLCARAISI